jgi:3-oxoacyl-[acyl-carrier protein] reductase
MKDLRESVAVVTGAASGVGLGIAQVLAQEHARVVIADVDARAADRAATTLRDSGLDAIAVEANVVDRASLDAMVAEVLALYGRVDIMAANAGIYPPVAIEDMSDADFDRVMNINVKGILHSIQASIPPMRERGYGRIVLTSSITGPLVGAPNLAHYAASKAAVLGLMRSAALEVVGDGITVNAVMPGNVRTPGIEQFGAEFVQGMVDAIPMKRLAEPSDVGWAVRFLASEEAGYITGQTLVIDGGQVLPEGPLQEALST